MKIPINKIKVMSGRREAKPEAVEKLAESMADIGMVNPVTVDAGYHLVAGLHRLEAAKLLGWLEVECSVLELDTLEAKLVEIDENLFRTSLTNLELSELIVERKKLYEAIHPERKRGGDRRSAETKPPNWRNDPVRSFAEDTAQLLGTSPRTIERHVQIGQKLTSETKDILKGAEAKITQQALEKLTRLRPGQQEEAAGLLADGKIRTVDEYGVPPKREGKTGRGIDNAALYIESFDQAVSQVRHLIGLFQERRETYSGMLSAQQLRVLGERAAQAVAILDGFIVSLDLQPAATGDNERRISSRRWISSTAFERYSQTT